VGTIKIVQGARYKSNWKIHMGTQIEKMKQTKVCNGQHDVISLQLRNSKGELYQLEIN
jgi:hypothetical protein